MNRTVYQPVRGCGCRTPSAVPQTSPCRQETEAVGCTVPPMQEMALAMAYVKIQTFGELYDPCTALIAGTVFPCLDKPFCGETVSASAYPNPPARTCDCALPTSRGGRTCGCQRGGDYHD